MRFRIDNRSMYVVSRERFCPSICSKVSDVHYDLLCRRQSRKLGMSRLCRNTREEGKSLQMFFEKMCRGTTLAPSNLCIMAFLGLCIVARLLSIALNNDWVGIVLQTGQAGVTGKLQVKPIWFSGVFSTLGIFLDPERQGIPSFNIELTVHF